VIARKGGIDHVTDLVLWPKSSEEISQIMALAYEQGFAIIPRGGGTTVLGGVEPGETTSITLNMECMDRIMGIDSKSQTVRVQAGTLGPKLEYELNCDQFTLGHFPQSFEFSTVGGWIASRSAGQFSSFYGRIEDMVTSIKLVTPQGIIQTKQTPATGCGPSLKDLIVGSEGALGVISETTLRIQKLRGELEFYGVYFSTFEAGIRAAREIYHEGLNPLMLRLSDVKETEMFFKLGLVAHNTRDWLVKNIGKLYFKVKGWHEGEGALMIIGFVKDLNFKKKCFEICGGHLGINLGQAIGKGWYRDRFKHPYLRDELITRRVFIETFETATRWENLDSLYRHVGDAIFQEFKAKGLTCVTMVHLSHVYTDGTSLYFTVMGPMLIDREIEQWVDLKKAVTNTVIKHGGTLSHHHGIGRAHMEWLEEEIGTLGKAILKSIKTELDPKGLLNPGVLV
jgi:alkyldihydroxyacetonephosphate synthase